jgi:hypothetical protein
MTPPMPLSHAHDALIDQQGRASIINDALQFCFGLCGHRFLLSL